ncbi:hypothetical protein CLOM_g17373, partial [Closterium sp. NIES-68]
AADEALKRDLAMAVRSGQVGAVLLVSDDRGYSRALGAAAAAGLTTVAVGINGSLEPSVHRWFWWGDVLSGRAVADARREGGGMWGRGREEGEGEWRDGGVLRTSRSEESAGQWEGDGEEWVDDVWDEEWDEDEWEGEGDEEDARSPGNEDFSHRVFGRAGSESRPHGNL